ncbi:hypothetical protein M0804_011562 [Polistes exclamans]|nr:hypothetical protein M0804_011562 [Polistes exclamans]
MNRSNHLPGSIDKSVWRSVLTARVGSVSRCAKLPGEWELKLIHLRLKLYVYKKTYLGYGPATVPPPTPPPTPPPLPTGGTALCGVLRQF